MIARLFGFCSVALAVAVLAGCGTTQVARVGNITIGDARAVPAADAPSERAIVYLSVGSDVDDELIGATVAGDLAASVRIEWLAGGSGGHLGHLDGAGAPTHTPQPTDRVPMPRGATVHLKPGVGHIVVEQLVRPLREGDRFSLTLVFASGAVRDVTVVVSLPTAGG
jgi:copper(I)-binding protein